MIKIFYKSIFIKSIFLLCVFSLLEVDMFAQKKVLRLLPDNTVPPSPQGPLNYNDPIGSTQGRIWQVYSDRSNNKSYTDPGGTTSKNTLQFLERFYVLEEEGAYLHIAKGNLSGPELQDVRDYGWIHKKHLVLYPRCVANKQGINRKAILLNNVEDIDPKNFKPQDDQKKGVVYAYGSPDLSGKTFGEARLFEVFYVIKELSNGNILLSQSSELGTQNKQGRTEIETEIFGWVNLKKIVLWDNRVAIEPNWNAEACKERKSKDTPLNILDKKQSALVFKGGQNVAGEHVYMSVNVNPNQRWDGQRWRFPVFQEFRDDADKDILRIGAMGKINSTAKVNNDPEMRASALKKYEKARKKQKNINFVFVIDATQNMEGYISTISKAIEEGANQLGGSNNSLRYGVVAYRDRSVDDKVKIRTLTRSVSDVKEFIEGLETNFNDEEEGTYLFEGISAAINSTGINSKHTNIIVVLGTEGGYVDSDVSEDNLINSLYQYNCHLIAMQLKAGESDTYSEFYYSMEDICKKAAAKRYDKYNKNFSNSSVLVAKPSFSEIQVDPYQKMILRNSAAMGTLILSEFGKSLERPQIELELIKIIADADKRVNDLLDRTDLLFKGVGKSSDGNLAEFDPSIRYFIVEQAEMDPEEYNSFSFNDYQASKEAYTTRKIVGFENPLFKSSLFLDTEELSDLHEKFKQLDNPKGTLSEQRESMYKAWTTLLGKYEGEEEDNYDQMPISEISRRVFGVPGNSPLLQNITPSQIREMDDMSFQKLASQIRNKRKYILGILDDKNYKYAMVSLGRHYYWITEDLLP